MSDMTSAVAIDLLDNLIGMVEDNQENDYDSALHMAIDALRAQADGDTVSRQDAINVIEHYCDNGCEIAEDNWCPDCQQSNFVKMIKELPPSPTPSRPQKPQIPFVTLQRACKYRCLSMDRYGGDTEHHPTCHHTIYASWGECAENTCPLLKQEWG